MLVGTRDVRVPYQGANGPPMTSYTLRRTTASCLLVLAAFVAASPALAQRGAMTVPRNLEQLTHRASDILRGTVISARVEKHPELTNLDTVVVTLRVHETLKGQAAGTYTFRQYLWDVRDRYAAAGYRKGDDVLLLMIAPSRYGLSSPAGMQQGRFQIERDRTGREVAVNGMNNVQLLAGLARSAESRGVGLTTKQLGLAAKHREGPVALNDLEAMIRAFAAAAP